TGLHKRPHALLQKKRIAFRPRDQRVLERFEAGLGPEEGGKKLLSGLRRQRIQPKLRVVGAAAPTVLIFWAGVHDQQQPGSRQALNENIELCLSLGHPLEVESGGRPCCRCRPIPDLPHSAQSSQEEKKKFPQTRRPGRTCRRPGPSTRGRIHPAYIRYLLNATLLTSPEHLT